MISIIWKKAKLSTIPVWNVILKVESTNPLRYDIIKEKKKEVKKNVDLQ